MSAYSDSPGPVLDPQDLASRLSRISETEYQSRQVEPSIEDTDDVQDMPSCLISFETLRWVGFNREKAHEIWRHWCNNYSWEGHDWKLYGARGGGRDIDGNPVGFEEAALVYLEHREDTDSDNDQEWRTLMDVLGINKSMQEDMLMPVHKKIRLTETCCFWLRDAMQASFAFIEHVLCTSRQRVTSRPSLPVIKASSTPIPSVMSPTLSANAPDHTVFYRGGWTSRFQGMDGDNDAWIRLKMASLLARPGSRGDFHHKDLSIFLSTDPNIALQYARWVQDLNGNRVPASVLSFSVPNSALQSMMPCENDYLYSLFAFWGELTEEWYHKNTVVISGFPPKSCSRLPQIREDWAGTFKGVEQYCFMGKWGLLFLRMHGEGFRVCHDIYADEERMQKGVVA